MNAERRTEVKSHVIPRPSFDVSAYTARGMS
jgi:hypothetical protein